MTPQGSPQRGLLRGNFLLLSKPQGVDYSTYSSASLSDKADIQRLGGKEDL
jgi:hypothetical protein